MPSFLSVLLVLVSTFVLGGKPVDVPPFIADELSQRGSQVSELVKHFPTLTPTPTQSEEPDVIDNSYSGNNDNQNPDTNKIPAYNNRSEKEMPVNLPQNAIDHSPALDSAQPNTTVTPTPDHLNPFVGSLGIYDEPDLVDFPDNKPAHPVPETGPSEIGTAYEAQMPPGHKN